MLPTYRHIINPKLKHTYLKLDEEGNLIIRSPKVSQSYLEKLLISKAAWIANAQQRFHAKKGKMPTFLHDSQLHYLGNTYPLILKPNTSPKTKLTFIDDTFILGYTTYDEQTFQRHIDYFYKEKAAHHIPLLVEKWSHAMALYPRQIVFRKTKRQWGSCSSKNILSFNTMMMKLPLDVIEYIVVHELVHIKHKHHQKPFWQLVESTLPDYKQRIAELKTYI